jgi:hypothetical protein
MLLGFNAAEKQLQLQVVGEGGTNAKNLNAY